MIQVLVVDDQQSVLDGIARGVHFKELGVDQVFFASGAGQALSVCRENPIDIAFMDVEMPGENGLVLNRRLMEAYPEMIRILLTSHAEFSYAQESTRTGCFGYILQPAPYEEIEECLKKALQELLRLRKNRQLARYGELMETNETELMDHVVLNLFSAVPSDVDESLAFLNQAGYSLRRGQQVQILIIDPKYYKTPRTQVCSEKAIHQAMFDALKKAKITYPVLSLTTVGPDRRFTVLLFSALQESCRIEGESYQLFFDELSGAVPDESFACYVGKWAPIEELRENWAYLRDTYVKGNVAQKAGIYFEIGEPGKSETTQSLAESVKRWALLLERGQRSLLEREIDSVIRSTMEKNVSKHRSLAELHQQLTHIFLSYFYDHDMDVSELFGEDYSYADYMDSFEHTETLKKAVSYMLDKAGNLDRQQRPLSDVERARNYIAENLAEPVTVRDVADHVGLSPEYFTKLFKQETGMNIKEYILQTKVEAAKEMIAHSDLSVSMVAMELGWSNFSHFTQVFKKYENMTPTEYKSSLSRG